MNAANRLRRLRSVCPSYPLAALALGSAVMAVVVSQVVFPYLSINNDEPIYRLQADAIAHGDLFLPTAGMPDAFRPWLAAVRDNHYVLKYPPFFPSLVALSEVLWGSPVVMFAGLAAAAVAMTYQLALEVLGDRKQALVAAALVALSPLAVILNALILPYMTAFVLLEVVAWGVFRGISTKRRPPLFLAGLAFGLVFAMRPFDTLLFGAPLIAYLLLRGPSGTERLRAATTFALPSLVGLGAFLTTNALMTGSALRPPFALLESEDALGFGVRRLFPTDVDHRFGPAQGVEGILEHGLLLNRWVVGGTLLLILAMVTLIRTKKHDRLRWLFVAGAMLPAGYLFFWGPWNAAVLWGGTRWVGPFYFLPVLIPLAMLGARGLAEMYRWRRWAAGGLAAAMGVFTVAAMGPVVRGNMTYTRQSRALDGLISQALDGRDKLVLVGVVDPFLMHPSAVVANRWNLTGPVLHAVSRGDADVEVATRLPDRTPYRLDLVAGSVNPDDPFSARLERLRLVRGSSVPMTLILAQQSEHPSDGLRLQAWGTVREYRLAPSDLGQPLALTMGAGGFEMVGRVPDREYPQSPVGSGLRIALITDQADAGDRASARAVSALEIPARVTAGVVEALVPSGASWMVGDPLPVAVRVSSPGSAP